MDVRGIYTKHEFHVARHRATTIGLLLIVLRDIGRQEIYVSCRGGINFLFRQQISEKSAATKTAKSTKPAAESEPAKPKFSSSANASSGDSSSGGDTSSEDSSSDDDEKPKAEVVQKVAAIF
jgi:hypothetical protein